MKKYQPLKFAVMALIVSIGMTIELPLKIGDVTCAALISTFDPIKVDLKFPAIVGHTPQQHFLIQLRRRIDYQIIEDLTAFPEAVLRKSFELKNQIYELCISYETQRRFKDQTIYIAFTQAQDFQSLIGRIEIPPEMSKQDNLKLIYEKVIRFKKIAQIMARHQQKQRELQDEIATKNIHKSQRILTLGLIEVLVIILSGVYQICALRKFLLEKNLY